MKGDEMTICIRPYRESDYEIICSWWREHKETPPLPGMMVEDGTFVVEVGGCPVMTMTVFTTQSKEISYFEGYCSEPGLEKKFRNTIGKSLWEHCYTYLRDRGYKRVLIFTEKHKLVKRYEELGMRQNVYVHSLGRVL